jgi:hypothetical protein
MCCQRRLYCCQQHLRWSFLHPPLQVQHLL